MKVDLGRLARWLIVTAVSGVLLYGAVFGTFLVCLVSMNTFYALTKQTHDGPSIIFGLTWFSGAMAGRHHMVGQLAHHLGLEDRK